MHLLTRLVIALVTVGLVLTAGPARAYVEFDGTPGNFIEIPDPPDPSPKDFSVSTTGELTISAWIRPAALCFRNTDGLGYVHWAGKGCPWLDALGRCCTPNPITGVCVESGSTMQDEWTFRMYSEDNGEQRDSRTSFYVFNLVGGEGIGSFVQDSVETAEWIHVVAVAEQTVDAMGNIISGRASIYKNGVFRKCDQYFGNATDTRCQGYSSSRWITPQHGPAPVRIGHRDRLSYFQGSIGRVRVWNRKLTDTEIAALYSSGTVPRGGLVAEYLLGEGSGTTAHDTAGGHDGMILGAAWRWGTDPEPGP